ncbi:MAG TPA: hypothetical protein VJ508_14875, partial [Saprospiraceae bacterium]|nr:hypothetical protein [Saprospiraceae bacterium]
MLLIDFFALNAAWIVFHFIRYYSGFFELAPLESPIIELLTNGTFLYAYWLIVFAVFGLYRSRYTRPLFDEFITVLKTLAFGTVFLILVVRFIWDPVSGPEPYISGDARMLRVVYALVIIIFVLGLRLALLSVWSRLLAAGIGRRSSLIIGERESAKELAEKVSL